MKLRVVLLATFVIILASYFMFNKYQAIIVIQDEISLKKQELQLLDARANNALEQLELIKADKKVLEKTLVNAKDDHQYFDYLHNWAHKFNLTLDTMNYGETNNQKIITTFKTSGTIEEFSQFMTYLEDLNTSIFPVDIKISGQADSITALVQLEWYTVNDGVVIENKE